MNYRKVKAKKTVSLPVLGRMPIQDLKQDLDFVLTSEDVLKGNRHRPDACAIALCIKRCRHLVPGTLVGAWVFKTHTLLATTINKRLRALRAVHPEGIRKAINGFDSKQGALKSGDVASLLAPRGRKRLGVSNGRSNPGSIIAKNPRNLSKCHKRGVFMDDMHRKAVEEAADKRASVV